MKVLLSLLLACSRPSSDAAPPGAPAAPAAPAATAPAAGHEGAPTDGVLGAPTGASLYALDLPLVTQDGAAARLDLQRGHPVLLSMFYTSCPMACPLLIQDIQGLEAGLTPEERAALRVVLVSLDPENDTPTALKGVVDRHGLDGRWTLGAVPKDAVREVAAALGVRYRPLPEGGFAHTAVLTLVDADGRIAARSEGSKGREELVAALRALVAPGAVTGAR